LRRPAGSGTYGKRTAWLAHSDGSWVRATLSAKNRPWCGREDLGDWGYRRRDRHAWLTDGTLPAYGAAVTISPDGSIRLVKGQWQTEMPAIGALGGDG
jgi:hypothetical protein